MKPCFIRSVAIAVAMLPAGVAADVLSLSGTDWIIHEDGKDSATIPATVPGNIQADLEAAHHLKPLWYGPGDARLVEVAQKDWWYRKSFFVTDDFAGKRVQVVFDGVDHECEVWLNGSKLGHHAGMFRRFAFETADLLRPGETNHLAVKIFRMPEDVLPALIGSDGAQSGFTLFIDGMNRVRSILKDLKSPTNWGWDWGVNVYTLGIWKDVRLEASGPARIDWVQVNTDLSEDFTRATVRAKLEIDSLSAVDALALFRVLGHGTDIDVINPVSLSNGLNVVTAELTLDDPALWWPNGHGAQPLYVLESKLIDVESSGTLHAKTTRFGVRDVQWRQTVDAPEDFINPFQLVVNGRPIRAMGSNLIPPDLLFGRISERGPRLIRRAAAAGMNWLRVWGGGVILPDEVYDLADEMGIMLSQEFPIANCNPEKDEEFLGNLETTTRNIIKNIRNHPAIMEWSGGNEMLWHQGSDHPALQLFERIVEEEDGRIFRATCPIQGSSHSPWDYRPDSHYVHYNQKAYMRYGEFGTQSPANLEVWHREIPPSSQWPIVGTDDPVLIRKNVVNAVFGSTFWLQKDVIEKLFGASPDLAYMVSAGQFVGAHSLRYAVDAMRQRGAKTAGISTWDFNEPWPNGAGSYLVDYDGRPLMNYWFMKQAIAPLSLSLRYESAFYDSKNGIRAELWLVSDVPGTTSGLSWNWLARDRRGRVFARNQGEVSVASLEAKQVDVIKLALPAETAAGPHFIELQLRDGDGNLIAERTHVFGMDGVEGPLAGLIDNRRPDADDQAVLRELAESGASPTDPANLAYVGNGAKQATASSSLPHAIHQPAGLNDGRYGNDYSWIGSRPSSSFMIQLSKQAIVGRFRLGRDRGLHFSGRRLGSLRIERSLNLVDWQTVYSNTNVAGMEDYHPFKTMDIRIDPVGAEYIRVTVDPVAGTPDMPAIDEFEVYAADIKESLPEPVVTFTAAEPEFSRPVRRTSLVVDARPLRIEGDHEVLTFDVRNEGEMTALFCSPHPLLEYRTDLSIDENFICVPPGEERVLTVRASRNAPDGLTLAQTGWRIDCWNADSLVVPPSQGVLLSVGRRDRMCREFLGYSNPTDNPSGNVVFSGNRPEPDAVPYLLDANNAAGFVFDVDNPSAALLRIHTSDQSVAGGTMRVSINGEVLAREFPAGYGIQDRDPAHLADPVTVSFAVPADMIQSGANTLQLNAPSGWFTLDALDLVVSE